MIVLMSFNSLSILQVLLFARNNTEFMENIGVAFQKMLDFGQKDLKVITLG